ncbi:MAG: hypothetical protein ACO3SE_08910 [Sedimenticolaceae bacterium]
MAGVTVAELSTTGLSLWDQDLSVPSVWGWLQQQFESWLGEICDPQLGAITASGSGYGADATYTNVLLKREDESSTTTGGRNLRATVVVTGGGISSVTVTTKGNGFRTGDVLQIADNAELAGTGSGFRVPVASADSSIGLMYGVDRRATNSYTVGFHVGYERAADRYLMGGYFYKSSNTSTTYWGNLYNHTPSTSNSTYGSWSSNYATNTSTWYNSNGNGYTLKVAYCSDPGNRFFTWVDNAYDQGIAFLELNQPTSNGEQYPTRQDCSPWCTALNGSSFTLLPGQNISYGTAYVGTQVWTPPYPPDDYVLYNKDTVMGRGFRVGTIPDRLYTERGNQPFGSTFVDGTDTYHRMGARLYVREGA